MSDLATRIDRALNTAYHRWDIYALPEPTRIAVFLDSRLALNEGQSWDALSQFVGMYVNGKVVSPNDSIPYPCRLEVYIPKFSVERCIADYQTFTPGTDILLDTMGIVVAYKPARLHTMPAREQKVYSLKRALEDYYSADIHMPSRLDFSTQGLVLVSRSSYTHDYAQQLFQRRLVKKGYLFATHVKPPFKERTLDARIGQDPRHAVLRKVVPYGGKRAITHFTFLKQLDTDLYVMLAKPETGRTHQIRVHAAHLGLPLVGDKFYAGASSECLHLACACLSFPLPDTREDIIVTAPDSHIPEWASGLSAQYLPFVIES